MAEQVHLTKFKLLDQSRNIVGMLLKGEVVPGPIPLFGIVVTQTHRDHVKALGKFRNESIPNSVVGQCAVHQNDIRSGARLLIGDVITIDLDRLDTLRHRPAWLGVSRQARTGGSEQKRQYPSDCRTDRTHRVVLPLSAEVTKAYFGSRCSSTNAKR